MKWCKICGKTIWHFNIHTKLFCFNLNLQSYTPYRIDISDKKGNLEKVEYYYEHNKCIIKHPRESLSWRHGGEITRKTKLGICGLE